MAEKVRKSYCKPDVKKVRLVPEEAVLANCKGPGWNGLGSNQGNCLSPGTPDICLSQGS
jgi:hypothetical protein